MEDKLDRRTGQKADETIGRGDRARQELARDANHLG
jgi:hypothetical protein